MLVVLGAWSRQAIGCGTVQPAGDARQNLLQLETSGAG